MILLISIRATLATNPADWHIEHLKILAKEIHQAWDLRGITFLNAEGLPGWNETAFEDFVRFFMRENIAISSLTHEVLDELTDIQDYFEGNAIIAGAIESPALTDLAKTGLLRLTPCFLTKEVESLDSVPLQLDSELFLIGPEESNSSHGMMIEEIYAIKNGPRIRQVAARWNEGSDLHFPGGFIWERRRDLQRVLLTDSTVEAGSLPIGRTKKSDDGEVVTEGYLIEVQSQLAELLNFQIQYSLTPDGQFGAQNPNGTWNGMIGMLEQRNTDMVISGLTVTHSRAQAIDFSFVLLEEPISLVMRQPDGQVFNVWAFLVVFDLLAWITFAITIIVLAVALMLIATFGYDKLHDPEDSERFDVLNGMAFVVIAMLQREYPISRVKASTKILVLVVFYFSFLFYAYYTAVMTSAMTVLEPAIKIRSFYDVRENGIQTVTLKGSSIETQLQEAPPDSPLYEIYHEDMLDNPDAFHDSFPSLLNAILSDGTKAMFGPVLAISYSFDELIALNLPDSFKSIVAMGLQKDSEFTKLFDYHILKMKQSGIMDYIHDKWFDKSMASLNNGDVLVAYPLNYDNLLFPSLLLSLGVLLALALAVLEFLTSKLVYNTSTRLFNIQ